MYLCAYTLGAHFANATIREATGEVEFELNLGRPEFNSNSTTLAVSLPIEKVFQFGDFGAHSFVGRNRRLAVQLLTRGSSESQCVCEFVLVLLK